MASLVTSANILEDNPVTCMARIVDGDGVNITVAGTSTVTVSVFDTTTGSVGSLNATGLTVDSSLIFDSLQEVGLSGNRWTKDQDGYNFRYAIPGSNFNTADTTYPIEFLFTPASGNPWFVVFEVTTTEVRTS